MRRKRQSPNQSRPRNTGWPGGETRLLALASAPPGGLAACGIASKGTQPVQSWAPSAPGTGSVPFPARRIGVRPASAMAMPPALSAIMRFCGGLVMRAAAARPSATVRARLSARRPAAEVSSGARLAMATARTRPPSARAFRVEVGDHRAVPGFPHAEADRIGLAAHERRPLRGR